MNDNICHLFFASSEKHPERTAIIERERKITFRALALQIQETAAYFKEKGIQPGDRILVFIPMSIDLYRITLALFQIGAVAVFLDEWVSLDRLKLCCKIADCKGFIANPKIRFLGLFIKDIRKIPIHLSATKRKINTPATAIFEVGENAPALITFTTGSVGTPKAAVRSHQFLRIQFDALQSLLQNGNERELIMLPIVLLLNLGSGKTSILADFKFAKPSTFSAQRIIQQIEKHQIQGIVASPSYLIALAKHQLAQHKTSSIRTLISGGSAIFPSDAQTVLEAFENASFTIVFGSTEAEPISHCSANQLLKNKSKTGVCVGSIDPIAEVRIIKTDAEIPFNCTNDEFNKLLLNIGETGEIIVAGKHVLDTYLSGEDILKTTKICTPTLLWHRTGDAGYLDNEQNLYLMGRVHQIFEHQEMQVYPFVAEKLIREIEHVELGTILTLNNKVILVYQAKIELRDTIFQSVFPKLQFDQIVRITQIPVDPRHRSKIDYAKLKMLLNK